MNLNLFPKHNKPNSLNNRTKNNNIVKKEDIEVENIVEEEIKNQQVSEEIEKKEE